MSESEIGYKEIVARSQREALANVLSNDVYVTHIVGHMVARTDLEHSVHSWRNEMVNHLREKYDVTDNIALSAISKCRTRVRQERG